MHDTTGDPPLTVVAVETGAGSAAVLGEWLTAAELAPVTEAVPDSDRVRLCLFAESPAEAVRLAATLERALAEAAELLPEPVRRLPNASLAREDWAESWKRHFKVRQVSPRLVVRPSWEPWATAPGQVVLTLDPGMSFGTGQHATTRGCLLLLDLLAVELPADAGVLDWGCGSGILAIAAARLGLRPVTAIDADPTCLPVTAENAATNGVADAIARVHAALGAWAPARPARLVVANILADVLVAHAPALTACLHPEPPGFLVVSGILAAQYPAVLAAYAAQGLVERHRLTLEGWVSAALARPEGGEPGR